MKALDFVLNKKMLKRFEKDIYIAHDLVKQDYVYVWTVPIDLIQAYVIQIFTLTSKFLAERVQPKKPLMVMQTGNLMTTSLFSQSSSTF